jgi:tRNA1Val (adenine37-N6)-methyltransferase
MREDVHPKEDETVDRLTCGNLSIFQKKKGYRFSVDSYLLAAFVEEEPGTEVLDIGSGSGVVSLLLASVKNLRMTGIEIQQELAEMSMRSVEKAELTEKVSIKCCNIKNFSGRRFDAILTNPPFRPKNTGRINPRSEKALARHELELDLESLLDKTYQLLSTGGRFYIVYPSWRLPDLVSGLREHRLEPKRLRFVHTTVESHSEICLVSAIKNGGKECVVERPVLVYSRDKIYHEEMESIFRNLCFDKNH